MKSRASRIKRCIQSDCVTRQQDFCRRTQVTTRLKRDIVNNSIRTPNSSSCDETDDDGCRNSSTGYCCVLKVQCKWIQSCLWHVTARNLHNFIQNLNLMGNSQNFGGLNNHKELRKSAEQLQHSERPYGAISTQNSYSTLNVLTVPYRRRTATALWTSLPLWHLAPYHCQSFVILTNVNKLSKIFETNRPLYSTNPMAPATHSDVTLLAIRICKNLAERCWQHRQ